MERQEPELLDDVAHSLIVGGMIVSCLTGLLVWLQALTEYTVQAYVIVIGLWMWGIGSLIASRHWTHVEKTSE